MSSLWDIGRNSVDQLEEDLKDDNRFEEVLEKHRSKFERFFQEELEEENSKHPYKIYRNIVEERELSTEERLVLEELKDEYAQKWKNQKSEAMS